MKENEVFIRENLFNELENKKDNYAHIIMIATKPDIVKQAPLYLELKNRWELVLLVHTWQHYDYNLSTWVLKEFWMEVDVNLNISWTIHDKYSQIVKRFWDFILELNSRFNIIPVPYVHWDTLTATTADKASFLNKFSVVHIEAWIRTFTPKKEFYEELFQNYEVWIFNWYEYYKKLQNRDIYELWSLEPFPEQFDTRWVEASAWIYALPHEIYKKTLKNEWFLEEKMYVVWNTVVDAVNISKQKINESKAFEYYPNMKWKDFIFVTIHRRENCENKNRFKSLFYAIKDLVSSWVYVCFLELNASKQAIINFWLEEELNNLIKKYPENFAYWPALAHHHEVIDMISKAWAVVTDSWSMQEEANIVWTPCVTLRFWSDRTETILKWANIIAPPINSKLISEIIKWSINNPEMKKDNIYWEEVSKKIVDIVLNNLEKNKSLFILDDKRLELEKYYNFNI